MFGRDSKAGRERISFTVERREDFQHVPIGGCGQGEAGGLLTRSSRPTCPAWEHTWLSLVGPGWEVRTKVGEAGLTDQVLTILEQLLQRLQFDSPGWLLQRLWVRVLWPNLIWSLSICILGLSLARPLND